MTATLRWTSGTLALGFLVVVWSLARPAEETRSKEWPIFRGNPLQTGVAGSDLSGDLEVLWTFKTKDAVEGAPAIAAGVVYVGSQDNYLYALDLATGKQKWAYKGGPFKASPSVRGNAVYAGDLDGKFHCVYTATGTKKWEFEAGSEISSAANFAKDTVLFGSGDEHLYCLSVTGKPLWKFKVPGGPVMGSPAVVGDRTFVSGCDSSLHVIDLATGKEQAAVPLEGQTGSSAAVVGDRLYVGSMSNQVLAVDWKRAEVVWRFESERNPQAFFASVAATDALVIAGSRDKHVHALDRQSGKEVWSFPAGAKVDSSPVVVGERVYVASYDGNLHVLDLAKGAELKAINLGKPVTGSPAVAENRLVIGTEDGTVYCLGMRP